MNENSDNDSTIKWIAIGCAAILAIILCCTLVGFGGLVWLGSLSPTEKAQISVSVPIETMIGEDFTFTIAVTNISNQQIAVDSLDISTTFLNGFIIESVNPAFVDTYSFSGFDGTEYQTYYFEQVIQPRETITFTFEGKAVASGDFSGEIDVCIDNSFNCKTDVVRSIVK